MEKYRQEGAEPVLLANDSDLIGTEVITDDYLSLFKGKIRHDAKKLSKAIMQLVDESVIARDKQRLLDYYFVKERL